MLPIPLTRCIAATLLVACLPACTTNRVISVAPEPVALGTYLAEHTTPDLRVVDSAGHTFWIHNPALSGDSLAGVSSREVPHRRLAIPLAQVRELSHPAFSAGRTLGLPEDLPA